MMEQFSKNDQFDFGKNWQDFSEKALTHLAVEKAKNDFFNLFSDITLKNKLFLDIGFGQGLSSLCALDNGADVVAVDINETCAHVLGKNRQSFFPHLSQKSLSVKIGSILSDDFNSLLHTSYPNKFDIVHSWGVLHHTGNMWAAIKNAVNFVAPQGYFVLAIYNKHWTSLVWRLIKKTYHFSPRFFQKIMIGILTPVIWLAKLLITQKSPTQMTRGMSFYYDVIDWVGGYPYEFASQQEIIQNLQLQDFELLRFIPAQVPTGCHQYVFRKK